MQFEEFAEEVTGRVQEVCGPEFKVESMKILKNNSVSHMGLSIHEAGNAVSPTIYLDDMYTDFCDGRPLEDIINDVLRIYSENRNFKQKFDIEELSDFTRIKDRVTYKLVSFDQNRELMEKIPYRKCLDLAVVYVINLGATEYGNASFTVYNENMNSWKVTEQILFEAAKVNTPKILPPEIVSMNDLLDSIADDENEDENSACGGETDIADADMMYVLSNKSRFCGATCMLYDGVLEKFADRMGTDIYIIPSSIHELILVPDNGYMDAGQMIEMISDVNSTQVAPEEILSYDLYFYSREAKSLNTLKQCSRSKNM